VPTLAKTAVTIFVLLTLSCSGRQEAIQPRVENGSINLSNWNFQEDGLLELNGTWEFFWKSFDPGTNKKLDYINVPGSWQDNLVSGIELPTFGYGTYRTRIILPEPMDIGISTHLLQTAGEVWINGTKVDEYGVIGTSQEATVSRKHPLELYLSSGGTELELVIKIANYRYIYSGIKYPLLLGTDEQIRNAAFFDIFFDFFFITAIFLIFLYHLGLFFFRKTEYGALFFSLLCISTVISSFVSGELILTRLFQDFPYALFVKLEYLSVITAVVFFLFYSRSQYESTFSRKFTWILFILLASLALLYTSTPVRFFSRTVVLLELSLIITSGFTVYSLFKAMTKKQPGSYVTFVGALLFLLAIINDVLFYLEYPSLGRMAPLGLFLFIISQSFILARKSSLALARVENLSVELEQEVVNRTRELVEANNQKTRFFINIAHETRTPLTLISNYLSDYMKKNGNPDELQIVSSNIVKLRQDMINYLDMEKLVNGRYIFDHSQVVDITSLLEEKIELYRKSTQQKRQILNSEIESDCFVKADPMAVERIINNLLDNAVKYTPEEGNISVALQKIENTIRIIVKDDGPEIPQEILENIFQPFYQLSHEKDASQGIGMGLAIVHEILEDLGGSIVAESGDDQETWFIVELTSHVPIEGDKPVSEAILQPTAEIKVHTQVEDSPFDESRDTVLVVEDNLDMLFYLVKELSRKFNVFHAMNGAHALQRLKTIHQPDCIISDVMMDTMNGMELLEVLQDDAVLSQVPFVFLTAKSSYASKIEALSLGAVDFISKPFSISEVLLKTSSLIQYRRKQKEDGLQNAIKVISRELSGKQKEIVTTPDASFEEICDKHAITDRQKEIIVLLSSGLEYKEIGHKLSIATKTVARHIQNIYDKTECHNKVEVVRYFKL
jgi:signal transduction histidine kinase/DNA-binding NarL/FixJ family response regulator